MVNPGADDLDAELRRFEYKVEAGAEFAVTRPVFDVRAFERFLNRTRRSSASDHRRLWPFESVLNAEFMANEVPGVTVPEALLATDAPCRTVTRPRTPKASRSRTSSAAR